jgi:hypothetical protein
MQSGISHTVRFIIASITKKTNVCFGIYYFIVPFALPYDSTGFFRVPVFSEHLGLFYSKET